MSWFHTVKTTNNQDYYHFEKYQTSKAAEINTRRVGCATLGHPRTTELKFGIILRPTRRALLSSDTVIDATTLCPPRWWTADTDVVVWQKKRTTDWSRSSVCSLFSSWSARARVFFSFQLIVQRQSYPLGLPEINRVFIQKNISTKFLCFSRLLNRISILCA